MMLPWLSNKLQELTRRRAEGRFPHALLITGMPGLGKRQLAQAVGRMLLCEQPSQALGACGECRGCALTSAGSHPDARAVEPEEGKRVIRIDQVRELGGFLMLKSQYAGFRVGYIAPAEAMNVNAANSLLKTLEEPPENAVLLLVAHQPSLLPATIRSRCQQLAVSAPPRAEAQRWLQEQEGGAAAIACLELAGGAPLQALDYGRRGMAEHRQELASTLGALRAGAIDPVRAAQQWAGNPEAVLVLLLSQIAEAIKHTSTTGKGAPGRLHEALKGLDLFSLYGYLDKLHDARRLAAHPLNEQLVLEQLFIDWCGVCRQSHTG